MAKEHRYDYWTREFINDRLSLSSWQSYRFFPRTPSGRIRSDQVMAFLNRRRRGQDDILKCLPHDLATMDGVVSHFSVSGISDKHVRAWLKRTKCVPPHIRITNKHILFSISQLESWLEKESLPHDRRYTA
jgi:hypothetical protein